MSGLPARPGLATHIQQFRFKLADGTCTCMNLLLQERGKLVYSSIPWWTCTLVHTHAHTHTQTHTHKHTSTVGCKKVMFCYYKYVIAL